MNKFNFLVSVKEASEKKFSTKSYGYDPEEVDKFLDKLIIDKKTSHNLIESLKNQFDNISQKNILLENELSELKDKLEISQINLNKYNKQYFNKEDSKDTYKTKK